MRINEISRNVPEEYAKKVSNFFSDSAFIERDGSALYTNWDIRDNGLVDVTGSVIIQGKMSQLPFKFGIVSGNFDCTDVGLTTYEGCPIRVGGIFDAEYNNCVNLKGAPMHVGRNFRISINSQLESLEYGPEYVGTTYEVCHCSKLTTLKGAPKLAKHFKCDNNKSLKSLKYLPKEIGFLHTDNLDPYEFRYALYSKIGEIRCNNFQVEKIINLYSFNGDNKSDVLVGLKLLKELSNEI